MSKDFVPGAQTVSRAVRILRALAESHPAGLSVAEVVDAVELTRPTAARLLAALVADGFVDHDRAKGRWYLGPELYLLGSRAADRYDIAGLALPHVRALAAATGESAFLSVRRGDETVCLLREEGTFPIRSFVLAEGVRFPLGVASAGMALLAFASDDEIDRYLAGDPLVARWGPQHSADEVRARVKLSREQGYSVNPGLILEGSWGMGAVVFDGDVPTWALSVTGVESRFRPARRNELGALLIEHAHRLSLALRASPRASARKSGLTRTSA